MFFSTCQLSFHLPLLLLLVFFSLSKLKVENRSSGNVTDAAARTETTKHQFHFQESKFFKEVLHRSINVISNQRDLIECTLVQGWSAQVCAVGSEVSGHAVLQQSDIKEVY